MSDNTSGFTDRITTNTTLLPTVQAWELYLQDQGKSIYTIKSFLGDIRLLASYFPPDKTLGSISTNDLNNFLNWLTSGRGVPCSPKSYARRITTLKSFFRWLYNFGILPANPAEKIVQKSVVSPLPVVLTDKEQTQIIETVNQLRQAEKADARPYALAMLILETGIKKGECLAIDLNHIDLTNPEDPFLFVRYANPQYRYKERKIPLSLTWIEAFNEYAQQYEPDEKLFPWSPRRLEYILEDLGEAAGLAKHLSFDMCRWSSSLNDWNNGVEHDKIRQKLGISKIQWREISMKLRKLANPLIDREDEKK
ncbi:MAG: site-specific integrase [Anaerolineaceae bacterium]|nr:site-specific integrase [Anaerolineaceae bacterium]